MIDRISRSRFDLLAIGTRHRFARIVGQEISWWAADDESIIGVVIRDRSDDDFGWTILVRDAVGRFRSTDVRMSLANERVATAGLRVAMAEKSRSPNFSGIEPQGGEPKKPLDLFIDRGVPDSKLHKYYLDLRDNEVRRGAKKVFQAISPWLVSSDSNLVRQFQESDFNQRLWEIYLWAMFRDQGYDITHQEAPDLVVRSPMDNFSVEATTVAPSLSGVLAGEPAPETPEAIRSYLENYMPMKFGSPLTSKLSKVDASGKHYWEKEGLEAMPFVIAIADFHRDADASNPASMTYTQSALSTYLYGLRLTVEEVGGETSVRYEPVLEHSYKGKSIPSGFFNLPEAENVAAVMFSNAGTIAKFDRIGILAGYGAENIACVRRGLLSDPNPKAFVGLPFGVNVRDPTYDEYWADEMQVFHNPHAETPLSTDVLPNAAHFFLENGEIIAREQPYRVLNSVTDHIHIKKPE